MRVSERGGAEREATKQADGGNHTEQREIEVKKQAERERETNRESGRGSSSCNPCAIVRVSERGGGGTAGLAEGLLAPQPMSTRLLSRLCL